MHSEVIAQVIDECRDKADAYLRCAEALAKLLPEPEGQPSSPNPLPPRSTPRFYGSQAAYQARVLALLAGVEYGVGISAIVTQTGIGRFPVARALRELQNKQQVAKVGEYKNAIYRAVTPPVPG